MIQSTTIKTILIILLLLSTLFKVNGTLRQSHLHLYGEISEEYGLHILGQVSYVSKSASVSMCLEKTTKRHAVEICNYGVSRAYSFPHAKIWIYYNQLAKMVIFKPEESPVYSMFRTIHGNICHVEFQDNTLYEWISEINLFSFKDIFIFV